jgi:hypothetical protein
MMIAAAVGFAAPAFAQDGPPPPVAQMDLNRDGQITRQEVDAHARTTFNEADTNNDGRLTREEFTAHAEARRAEHQAMRAQNPPPEGGAQPRREGRSGRDQDGRRGPPDPAEAFARTDWNQDGFINIDEFLTHPRMMAQRADRNADGVLSGDELQPRRHGGRRS